MDPCIVRNVSDRPLVINSGRGRALHLIPGEEAEVSSAEIDTSQVKALLDQGELVIVDDDELRHKQPHSSADGERDVGMSERRKRRRPSQ
jgi:hypothetical protein